ncbi:MAG TPA: serine hydrolase [Melioribacteraceae bacterium]|nr:serine hydrolase [Melioribacteraceae bacterium]
MSSKIKYSIFFFILFILSPSLKAQEPRIDKIDSYISQAMKDWKMPGFAVAIVKNDSVIFAKGYGVKDIRSNEPVDQNTNFMIASCSKAFTTASIARLADQGKLKWDDPVIKHLPYFQMYDPWVTKEMTIRDLVTHRSGLATFSGDILWLGSTYSKEEVIKRAQFLKPTSSFRSRYGYQNIMYSVAGEVIEAVSDTNWHDYVKYNFFNPLGMNRSVTSIKELKEKGNNAWPHRIKDGNVIAYNDYYSIETVAPAGAINSSVHDMAQWIRLQLNKGKNGDKRIFSERQSFEMWANHMFLGNNNYGLGWFSAYSNGKRVLNHGGGMPGMISDVTIIPEEKLGMVILSNLETGMVSAIKNYIVDVMLGVEPKDYNKTSMEGWKRRTDAYERENKRREEIRVKDSKPSLALEKYCGIYEDKMYGRAEVTLNDGKLFMQFIPSPEFRGELKHYQFDQFYIDWQDEFLTRGWIKFDMNFNGEIKDFTIEVPNSPDFIFTELFFEKVK